MSEFLVCYLCSVLLSCIILLSRHSVTQTTGKRRSKTPRVYGYIMRGLFTILYCIVCFFPLYYSYLVRRIKFCSHHAQIHTHLWARHVYTRSLNLHLHICTYCFINFVMLTWTMCYVSTVRFNKLTPHPRNQQICTVAVVYVVHLSEY